MLSPLNVQPSSPEPVPPVTLHLVTPGTSVPDNEQDSALPAEPHPRRKKRRSAARPCQILVIDIGGTNAKFLASGHEEPRKVPSGKKFTPEKLLAAINEVASDWTYEAVSIGFPGVVDEHGPILEPGNLGKGWVGFDFSKALGKPVKVMNDAAMQALGSYEGGRMLFLGLGTGVGSTLISDRTIVPLELGGLPYREGQMVDYLAKDARKKLGEKEWEKAVHEVVGLLKKVFAVDYILIGGGCARKLSEVPAGARLGSNENAFLGGFRLWNQFLPDARCLGIPRLKRPTWRAEWRVV